MMRFTRFSAILAVAVAAFSASASAQKFITLEMAQAMAQEAMVTCHSHGFKVDVLIVDSLDKTKLELRDDGTPGSVAETAKVKAYSALVFAKPSGMSIGKGETRHTPTIVPGAGRSMGGVPVIITDITGGELVIGAIAVTGISDEDMEMACANAGLAKVAAKLGAKTFAQPPAAKKESGPE